MQAVPVRIAVIFDLYVDRGTQSYLGRLHNSFVHGRVCVDCVCDLLYRRSQRFGERRLGQHFGYVRSHQMCSQQLVVLVEDQFYEAVAVACGFAPLAFSVPVVVASAFLLLRIAEHSRIGADAAIAVLSASALAIGIVVTSLTTGMTTDVDSYMFGSILAMSRSDVILSVTLALCVLALYILFYHKLFSVTFDESFARATGVRVGTYKTILSVLTALTVVLGMRMMGALLISSLLIFPALTSMRLCHTFQSVVICSAVLSVVCFLLGMSLSFFLSSPAGATVVIVNLLAFLIFSAIARIREHTA